MVINSLKYHRNGVVGAGYFVARLTFRADGHRYDATAIVFEREQHVAITADNGEIGFRCEDFEDELRAFIKSPAGQQMCWPHSAVA